MERKSFIELLALTKVHIAAMIGVLTADCPIDIHAVRLNILKDSICQNCNEDDEVETSRNILLHYPAFVRLAYRLPYFLRLILAASINLWQALGAFVIHL